MGRTLFIVALAGMVTCSGAVGQNVSTSSQANTYSSYYVSRGDSVEKVDGDPAGANYTEWQVWLYPQSVRVLRSGSGLVYTRWGVMQGLTAGAVMQQLAAYQQFESAYQQFFGASTWGQLTFSYPLGPMAVADPGQENDPYGLKMKIELLDHRLTSVVTGLRPSLVNGERGQADPAMQQSFEQVRNSMQDVARFYDRLSRLPSQQRYLAQELALVVPGVGRAESAVPKVRAVLPSVRLPLSKDWMTHSEPAGRDGTIDVTVAEMGSTAWVQQTWRGGDGAMAGTKIITIVPYQKIGNLAVEAPHIGNDQRWTVRIEPADPSGFPQSVTSPERITATRTYGAVNLKANEEFLFLEFSNPGDAQNAYTFFLYHKERGM